MRFTNINQTQSNTIATHQQISDLLKELGFPCSRLGYRYLVYGLGLLLSDNTYSCLQNKLYPKIAENYNVSPASVERAIRYSIESAFTYLMPDELIYKIFKNSYSSQRGKPTNSEFLACVVEYIKHNL